jgi:bloom syndrome protein
MFGKSSRITIMFSPLLSLTQDQVDHLRNLNIMAFSLSRDVGEQRRILYVSLNDENLEKLIPFSTSPRK